MKLKRPLASTGHGTGAIQQTLLHRSRLLLQKRRRVVLVAAMSERELAIRALLALGHSRHERRRLIWNHRGRWPFKVATNRRRRADRQVAA